MIVVCTGCAAKFKVADEKVGPRGAKLRCSRCGTVFTVRREEEVPAAPGLVEAAPPPSEAASPPAKAAPPPLPRRSAAPRPASPDLGAPVDARSAFEIDLEPPAPAPRAPAAPDPFSAPPPEDPFAPAAPPGTPPDGGPPVPVDPFGGPAPPDDPFAAVQAPIPPELLQAAPAPAPTALDDDPFSAALPPLPGAQPDGDLALEERTIPPPRQAVPQSSAPLDDPFAAPEPAGDIAFDQGRPGDIPPMVADLPGEPYGGFGPAGAPPEPPAAAAPRRDAPLRADPFAAAAVDADPLQAAPPAARAAAPRPEPARAAAPGDAAGPAEADGEAPALTGDQRLLRLRRAAVNAVSLLALLVVAVALLVVWRGNLPLSEAVQPSRLLAAVTNRDRAPPTFQLQGVSSGHYERASGPPLLFVRGEVHSNAAAPVAAVRVAVELVRNGAVLARGEGVAGGLPSPEELHGVADAAGLARVAEAAAARAPRPVAPGQSVPFLVALADYPGDLAGVALRVHAEGAAR